jgi:hypothetical protein
LKGEIAKRLSAIKVPDELDWRKLGFDTPVKSQGMVSLFQIIYFG